MALEIGPFAVEETAGAAEDDEDDNDEEDDDDNAGKAIFPVLAASAMLATIVEVRGRLQLKASAGHLGRAR